VGLDEDVNGKGDLFKLMINEFQNPFVVIFYLGGVFSLAWHLLHGFSSAFQTFGLNHKKYTPLIKTAGTTFSIIVPLVFALMPVSIYLGWIK
jgi:succinate dehydrogenase / fumarate reductase, cytochrome b subunit